MIRFFPRTPFACAGAVVVALCASLTSLAAGPPTVGKNFVAGCGKGDPANVLDFSKCDPAQLQQNEPSLAVSTNNPLTFMFGVNGYQTVKIGELTGGPQEPFSAVGFSYDGGASSRIQPEPGCPQNTPYCNEAQELKGLGTRGADPVLCAAPFGLFLKGGILFNPADNSGAVYGSIWVDDNNPEKVNDHTTRRLWTRVIDINTGLTGHNQDRPSCAWDKWRPGGGSFTIPAKGNPVDSNHVPATTVPVGRAYLIYTTFTGSNSSQIRVSYSDNGGQTWSAGAKVSTGGAVQGSAATVDPVSGALIVTWTQFNNDGTATLKAVISQDKGRNFLQEIDAAVFNPLNQDTNLGLGTTGPAAMRMLSVPAIAVSVDHSVNPPKSWAHVVTTSRVGPMAFNGPRDGRVVMYTAAVNNFASWSGPTPVFTPPVVPYYPGGPSYPGGVDAFGNLTARGHQFFSAISFSQGTLMVLLYSMHNTNTEGQLWCVNPGTGQADPNLTCAIKDRVEVRIPVGDLPSCPDKVFTSQLFDGVPAGLPAACSTPLKQRQTAETWAAQGGVGPNQNFMAARVSQPLFGSAAGGPKGAKVLRQVGGYNAVNLRLFQSVNGIPTAAFLGDYNTIAAAPDFVVNPTPASPEDQWMHNTRPDKNNSPTFYAIWTSNQDVVPDTTGCTAGVKNQNAYVARITAGLFLSSRNNSIPLDAVNQREFVLNVHNSTGLRKGFQLLANQPKPNGTASFLPSSFLDKLLVAIPPSSAVARGVFVKSSTANAKTTVEALEVQLDASGNFVLDAGGNPVPVPGGLQSTYVLNPNGSQAGSSVDSTTDLTTLDLTTGGAQTVNLTNTSITNPPVTLDLTTTDLTTLDLTTTDLTTTDLTTTDLTTLDLTTTDLTTTDLTTTDLTTTDLTTTDLTTGTLMDINFQTKGISGPEVASNVKLAKKAAAQFCNPSTGLKCQLILQRLSARPVVSRDCRVRQLVQGEVVANIVNPVFVEDSQPTYTTDLTTTDLTTGAVTNATIAAGLGESTIMTLRVIDPDRTHFCSAGAPPPCIDPANDMRSLPIGQAPPTVVHPLTIIGFSVPSGTIGQTYNTTLNVVGAPPGSNFCILTGAGCVNAGAPLPPGVSLNAATGQFTGIPTDRQTAAGIFNFTIKITGPPSKPQEDVQKLSLTIDKGATTTTASTARNPSVTGETVTVNVTVAITPANPAFAGFPAGAVTVTSNDGAPVSCPSPSLTNGSLVCTVKFLTAGAKTLTASYAGDNNFLPSAGAVNHVVLKADTVTAITSDLPDPSIMGQPFTVSATVTPVAPGSGAPTGTVVIGDGVASCNAVLSGGAGSCTLTLSTVGQRTLTATYAGDANYNGSGATAPHRVVYTFSGFFSPLVAACNVEVTSCVSNFGSSSQGQALPLKWAIKNFQGVIISNKPSSLVKAEAKLNPLACPAPPNSSPGVTFCTANGSGATCTGNSSFRYDSKTNAYMLNADTNLLTKGACYDFMVSLDDTRQWRTTGQLK